MKVKFLLGYTCKLNKMAVASHIVRLVLVLILVFVCVFGAILIIRLIYHYSIGFVETLVCVLAASALGIMSVMLTCVAHLYYRLLMDGISNKSSDLYIVTENIL